MAIVTLDGVVAGMKPGWPIQQQVISGTYTAGLPVSSWPTQGTGYTAAGAAPPTTTVGGTSYSSSAALVTGQIPHFDPAAGKNSYLAQFMAMHSGVAGVLQLCDRLNANATLTAGTAILSTATAAQAIVNAALPARDANGASVGVGVLAMLECQGTMGASTSTSETLVYNDANGTTGNSVTSVDTVITTAPAGTCYRFPLVAGGTGVASTVSVAQQATMTSGQWAVVLYRVLATLAIPAAATPAQLDALTSGFPQLYNGVVPFLLFIPASTTAGKIQGFYQETQG